MTASDTPVGGRGAPRVAPAWIPRWSQKPAPDLFADNIDIRPLAWIFAVAAIIYLGIYAFEAPVRYALYLTGKNNYILLRDGLLAGPLVLLLAGQILGLRIHAVFVVAAALLAFHGLVLMGTVGSPKGAAYGAKILMNVIYGYFLAGLLLAPSRRVLLILAALWGVTLLGLCLDKFVLTFPWTGIRTIVGDLNVDVSKDWQIQDTVARRVAGFTRSSIAAAVYVPMLAIVLMSRVRPWFVRGFIAAASVAAVALTTQKGALLGFIPVAGILCLPPGWRPGLLRWVCAVFLILMVSLSLLTSDIHLPHGTGVFSTESLYLRIQYTWPQAWQWITHHQMLLFGVGLGGIGGPQRIYAPDNFNPADNFFVLLYAYFGIFALIYLGLTLLRVFQPVTGDENRAATAIAVLAFAFGYGTVLSIVEDQAAALFLGAALGVLWRETRRRTLPHGVPVARYARRPRIIADR